MLYGETGCRKTMGDDIGCGWSVTRAAPVGESTPSSRVYLGPGRLPPGTHPPPLPPHVQPSREALNVDLPLSAQHPGEGGRQSAGGLTQALHARHPRRRADGQVHSHPRRHEQTWQPPLSLDADDMYKGTSDHNWSMHGVRHLSGID